jgi:hypothetical protein
MLARVRAAVAAVLPQKGYADPFGIGVQLPPRSRELAVSYRREVKQMRVVSGLEEAHRLLADGLFPVLAGARSTGSGRGRATERDTP